MRTIVCKFIDPNENLDLKKKYGYQLEADATWSDGKRTIFYFRKEIIELIGQTVREKNLIGSKKIINEKNIEYTFIIKIEKELKAKVQIEIPKYLFYTDPTIYNYKSRLDRYENTSIHTQIKSGLALIATTSVALAGTFGFGCICLKGIETEFESRYKTSKEYYEEYKKFKEFEEAKEAYEQEQKEIESEMYSTAPTDDVIPNNYVIYETNERIKTKTYKK